MPSGHQQPINLNVPTGVVLLVEDDDDDAFFFRRTLKESGIGNVVHRVRDADQALNYLEGIGEYAQRHLYPFPFAVMVDLELPRRSGFDILHWLRSKMDHKNISAVVITASRKPKDVASAYEFGARAYLTKPTCPQDFLELFRALQSRWVGLGNEG